MSARPAAATAFHALHRTDLLVLPNAWDAASARLIQDCAAKAIATSSAALAWSHGFADGHHLPIARLVASVEEIARVVSVPITVDAERGLSDDPAEVAQNIAALIRVGAIGVNLEDGALPHALHLKKITAVREAATREGVDLFINARVDVFLKKLVAPEAALEETLRRAWACKEAGASGLFVPGLIDAKEIGAIAREVDLPLNVMARPGLAKAAALKALGVRRISAATAIFGAAFAAVRAASEEFLSQTDADLLAARVGAPPAWNDMFNS